MATFETTVLIARPIEDVFAFLSDLENVPKWNYGIVETRKISEGPIGVGTVDQQVRSVPSQRHQLRQCHRSGVYHRLRGSVILAAIGPVSGQTPPHRVERVRAGGVMPRQG